eukprot:GHRR01013653.1.p1 GENE.GHRR01013653.1~~GHRR01013653.1.p1  ORF type:complete len:463 (+),score=103.73 GHRR01013653.1:445-1833(+)
MKQGLCPNEPASRARCRRAVKVLNPVTADQQVNYALVELREQCRELRVRVCKKMLAGGLVYLSGGDLKHRNGADVYYPFRPHSNFVYLTGITEPGFACLLDPESQKLTLVAPKAPDDAAVWSGGLPSLDQIAEEAGADICIYAGDLPNYLQQCHPNVDTLHILDYDHPDQQQQLLDIPHICQHQPQQVQQLAGLQAAQTVTKCSFNTAFLNNTLNRCRSLKTAAEVACLLEASKGSAEAHKAIWRACKPGMKEYHLEAAFGHAAGQHGLRHLGYPCIVGAGRNAAVLHYERNSATVGPNDLVLVDAGAEYCCYTADITRTFPANGTFTPQHRDIYDLVLSLQEHALNLIKPGATWSDIQHSTRQLLLDHLQQLGLVQGSMETLAELQVDKIFMPHGLGHFLGLDVHDVSDVGPVPQQLQEGQCITVEPGVYFMPLLLDRALSDPKKVCTCLPLFCSTCIMYG